MKAPEFGEVPSWTAKVLRREAKKYQDLAEEMEDAGDSRKRGYVVLYRERVKLLSQLANNFEHQDCLDDE